MVGAVVVSQYRRFESHLFFFVFFFPFTFKVESGPPPPQKKNSHSPGALGFQKGFCLSHSALGKVSIR